MACSYFKFGSTFHAESIALSSLVNHFSVILFNVTCNMSQYIPRGLLSNRCSFIIKIQFHFHRRLWAFQSFSCIPSIYAFSCLSNGIQSTAWWEILALCQRREVKSCPNPWRKNSYIDWFYMLVFAFWLVSWGSLLYHVFRFERERTCPLCRALVKPADIKSYGDGSTSLFLQLF